jgi:hypothetical protein
MILVLPRGHFCPKAHRQHLELAANNSKIAVASTQIVTISTDNILEIDEFRTLVGAQGTFLSTPVARSKRICRSRSTPTRTTTR